MIITLNPSKLRLAPEIVSVAGCVGARTGLPFSASLVVLRVSKGEASEAIRCLGSNGSK